MESINKKGLEKALAAASRPYVHKADETPLLSALEMLDRVKEIYMLGFEDGARQRDGDQIISKIKSDAGH